MSIARNIINMINVNEAGKKKPKKSEEERARREQETQLYLQRESDKTSMEKHLANIKANFAP